jgi:hypothetical protein
MFSFRETMRLQSPNRRPASACLRLDDRGTATLEAVIVLALFAGVFVACLLLGQWGASLQASQMGARLLAFDAGDTTLAKLGRHSHAARTSLSPENWYTKVDSVGDSVRVDSARSRWLGGIFTLANYFIIGDVTGTTRGRLPGQRSLFDYSSTNLSYGTSHGAAAVNSWGTPESAARSKLLRVIGFLVMSHIDTGDIVSTPIESIPPQVAVLETIFRRVGIR